MIKVEVLTEEDIANNVNAFLSVGQLYDSYEGDYFKLIEDDGIKIIHCSDFNEYAQRVFTILKLEEDKSVSFEQFCVNEDYNIELAGFEDYIVMFFDGDIIITDKKTGNTSSIVLTERPNGLDNDGYTGSILYTQYNVSTDERCFLTFQQMYNDFKIIYESSVKNPFTYRIEIGISKGRKIKAKNYVRSDFDVAKNSLNFDLVTIKEYGLVKFLLNGSCKLQKNDRMTRYLRNYKTSKNGYAITGFPFTNIYSKEEIFEDIQKRGFNIEVPDYLIQLNNGEHSGMKRYKEILDLVKELCNDVEYPQNKKLTFNMEDNDGYQD